MRMLLMMLTAVGGAIAFGCEAAEPAPRSPGEAYLQTLSTAAEPHRADADPEADIENGAESDAASTEPDWRPLFDGETLDGWEVTEFGGEGDVYVEDNSIILGFGGNGLTGITWTDEAALPTMSYEIELEAMRVDGNDFFCGLTFPVGDRHCSLIVGGWGGTVVGLSSLDGFDASQNDTTILMPFDSDQWYRIRLRVEPERIQAWIDDEQVIDAITTDRRIDIRWEMSLARPLGVAAWNTASALRNIRLRELEE